MLLPCSAILVLFLALCVLCVFIYNEQKSAKIYNNQNLHNQNPHLYNSWHTNVFNCGPSQHFPFIATSSYLFLPSKLQQLITNN